MNWVDTTVGNFCPFKYGKTLRAKDRKGGGVPVYGSNGIVGYHNEACVEGGGVIIGRKGSVGCVHYSDNSFWPIDTTFYVSSEVKSENLFCSYLLSTLGLQNMNSDTAVPGLNRNYVHSLPIRIPRTQKERANLINPLRAIDDKIELNRRTNETLEAVARTIFKDWFVDFGPTRAKMEGRDPYLPQHLVDIFPTRLVNSELGQIPEGWATGTVADLADRIIDKVDHFAEWQAEPLIDLSRMPQREIALMDWGLGGELTTSITRFQLRDTLFGAIRPYFHKVGVAPVNGVTNVSVFVVRAKVNADWPFIALFCSMSDTVSWATRVAKGTKMPVVSWPDFADASLVVPTSPLRMRFNQMVGPLLDRIIANAIESNALAATRDALFPKLISGEIRVEDVGGDVGEAV